MRHETLLAAWLGVGSRLMGAKGAFPTFACNYMYVPFFYDIKYAASPGVGFDITYSLVVGQPIRM